MRTGVGTHLFLSIKLFGISVGSVLFIVIAYFLLKPSATQGATVSWPLWCGLLGCLLGAFVVLLTSGNSRSTRFAKCAIAILGSLLLTLVVAVITVVALIPVVGS